MQYILLLRSVNLGKLRKVSMPELKKRLAALGYENVTSYINSGNLLFVSSRDKTTVAQEIPSCWRSITILRFLSRSHR